MGVVNEVPAAGSVFSPNHIHVFTDKSTPYPKIYCPESSDIALQVILYDRPHPRQMQYLSLEPISLALSDRSTTRTEQAETEEEKAEVKEKERKSKLVEKLKLHTVARPEPTVMEESLSRIIDQINCSYEMKMLLLQNVVLVGSWTRPKRSLSVSERVVVSAQSVRKRILLWFVDCLKLIWPSLTKLFVLFIVFWRVIAEGMLKILEWRLRPELAALKDISATGMLPAIFMTSFHL